MKRSKRLYILLGVLALICAATLLVTRIEDRKEQIKSAGETVLAVPVEEIQSLSWEYGGSSFSFHRGDGWRYDDDDAFPVDGEALEGLLAQFQDFAVSFVIEDVTDFGLYGLEEPTCVIYLETEAESYTVALGDYSAMDAERYVSIGDGNVYLAKVDPLESFDAALDDFLRHDESLSYDTIRSIRFAGEENYTITHQEDSDAAFVAADEYYTQRGGATVPLDTDRVESYLEALTTLSLRDYVTYNATAADIASCGLDDPELTVTVDYVDLDGEEESYTLSICRDRDELAAATEAEANGEEPEAVTAYVRVGDSQLIYRVTEYGSNALRAASYNELRHREVLAADFDTVSELTVTLEGKSYTLLSKETDDGRVWHLDGADDGEEIDLSDVQDALEDLQAASSDDFTADSPTGKKEIGLTVRFAEDSRDAVRIDLYRQDGARCLAQVDGESFAFVPRSDVVTLIEAVNAIVLR